jgi:hypothetical protein
VGAKRNALLPLLDALNRAGATVIAVDMARATFNLVFEQFSVQLF